MAEEVASLRAALRVACLEAQQRAPADPHWMDLYVLLKDGASDPPTLRRTLEMAARKKATDEAAAATAATEKAAQKAVRATRTRKVASKDQAEAKAVRVRKHDDMLTIACKGELAARGRRMAAERGCSLRVLLERALDALEAVPCAGA